MATDYREITRWGRLPAWWMFHPEMNADRLCLLAALATYADERGLCSPSQSTIARHLKRSRPWVNRVIAELVEIGLVEKRNRSRQNGGTTSCEYVLRFTVDSSVTTMTAAVSKRDTPCHVADTNQVDVEHKQPPCAEPRADEFSEAAPDEEVADPSSGPDPSRPSSEYRSSLDGRGELPSAGATPERGWQPSPEVRNEAARLFPDADIETHIALFVSRIRGKGYCIDPRRMDDTWLSWFIEDHRAGPERSQQRPQKAVPPASNTYKRMHRYDRFAAWAEAALT